MPLDARGVLEKKDVDEGVKGVDEYMSVVGGWWVRVCMAGERVGSGVWVLSECEAMG